METIKLSRRNFAFGAASTLVLTACSAKTREYEAPSTRYEKTTLPSEDGINGADYTEVTKYRFAIDEFGDRIYKRHPKTGNPRPVVVAVEYEGTFVKPGMLSLAEIAASGLLSVGGQYILQERCITSGSCGSSGGGTVIQNINQNAAKAASEVAIEATKKMF